VLERLIEGGEREDIDPMARRYLRDVLDHVTQVNEQVDGFRALLSDILSVNLTLVGNRQNDQTKKISGWAAILFAPTLVAAIYGMNFEHMPELHWLFGYPFALTLMVVVSVTLYLSLSSAPVGSEELPRTLLLRTLPDKRVARHYLSHTGSAKVTASVTFAG
jgi:magnesium transporter